MLNLRVDLLQD
jgi:mRNA (2'-O-methyladenosine-N6-)-methyltransferase